MKNKNQDWKKGKTYEEIYGKEKAQLIKNKMSKSQIGREVSPDTRRKIGLANRISLKGNTYFNKGKFKKGRIPWNKGKKTQRQSEISQIKRANSVKRWHAQNKGTQKYKKRNKKIALSQLGELNNSKGIIAREKNRVAHLGEKCSFWQGGISFEPYSVDWTKTLKRAIKERDNFKCQLCGEDDYLVIHHIDYNKKNSSFNNLITLCPSCHSKTNINREKWKLLLTIMMKLKSM